MPISSSKACQARGFTLVEILVVVLVIGLSLGMIFRMDYSSGPMQVKNHARQFAGNAELILDEAVLSGDFWGIDVFNETVEGEVVYGYRWLRRRDDLWQQGAPAGMDDFAESALIGEGFALQLEVEGLSLEIESKVDIDNPETIPESFSPDIWLYPDHETTAFSLAFSSPVSEPVVVQSDMLGRFRIVQP